MYGEDGYLIASNTAVMQVTKDGASIAVPKRVQALFCISVAKMVQRGWCKRYIMFV